jgi:hypothetical protein
MQYHWVVFIFLLLGREEKGRYTYFVYKLVRKLAMVDDVWPSTKQNINWKNILCDKGKIVWRGVFIIILNINKNASIAKPVNYFQNTKFHKGNEKNDNFVFRVSI